MKEIQAIVHRLRDHPGRSHALATLVSATGSSYRRTGARLLLGEDGSRIGSISGGCLESDLLERARAVLANGRPTTVVYDTSEENDRVWGVGLGCHGVVRIFIERVTAEPDWSQRLRHNFEARTWTPLSVIWSSAQSRPLGTRAGNEPGNGGLPGDEVFFENVPPPIRLLVFGAGDDAQPLVRLARELGWTIHVFDPRRAYATQERFPAADLVSAARAEEAAAVPVDAQTVAAIMTHHYAHDVPILRALLPRELPYLGLLGPRRRAEKILGDLAGAGLAITEDMRSRLHAPIGLDLGGDTPESVALAMLAEMQAVLAGRDSRPLRERLRPIHA